MHVWLNRMGEEAVAGATAAGGWLVPAAGAVVPVHDRGLLLGDGLFETVRIAGGGAPLLDRHLQRLRSGCRLIHMPLPMTDEELTAAATALVAANGLTTGYLRITVTRGAGQRGYEAPPDPQPQIIMTAGPWQPPSGPMTVRLAAEPILPHPVLNKVKHTSALSRVLLRTEARQAGADEVLLVNTAGNLVEGVATNLFWVRGGTVFTPDLEQGALPGIGRQFVLETMPVVEGAFPPAVLAEADEVFLTNALLGPAPVGRLTVPDQWQWPASDQRQWPAPGPVTARLQQAWRRRLGVAG